MIFQLVGVDHHVDGKIQRLMQKHFTALHWMVDLLLFNQADQLKDQLLGDGGGGLYLHSRDLLKGGGSVVGDDLAVTF